MEHLIKRLRERRTLISMNGIHWHPSEVPDADCIEAADTLEAAKVVGIRQEQTIMDQEAEIERLRKDAERYRLVRLGRYWSVINGVGNDLRAEDLDAAIDAAKEG